MASISNKFKSSATFLMKTYTKPVLLTGQLWSSFTLNVAARPINLGLYPWEEIAQVFMVSGTFGVLKTESKFYVTECHNLQQYHPINISIYLSKPSEFTRAELSLVSIPSLQTNCSILYCTQKGINSPNLLLLKDGFECTHNGHTETCSCVHYQDKTWQCWAARVTSFWIYRPAN